MIRFFQPAPRSHARPARVRLTVDTLEAREVPATLTVNTVDDNTTSDAVLTLREAICIVNSAGDANAALGRSLTSDESNLITGSFGSDNTVKFLTSGNVISLGSALPLLSQTVTIDGPGAKQLAVSGNHSYRVFEIASNVTVNISGLTIREGHSSSGGGGILNGGTLNLTKSSISGNQVVASFAQGGGIFNSGVANISDSNISGNMAIANIGQFVTAHGGGIFNFGTLKVSNSTISSNQAIATGSSPQALGGAIFNSVSFSATITQSTLANNLASGTGGPSFVQGGGLYNYSAIANIANSIIADNLAVGSADVYGGINSQGHNLVGNTAGSSGWAGSDLQNIAPNLGPLADNGGSTLTHALLQSSPAINAGSNTLSVDTQGQPLSTDQRGGVFARIVGSAVDIGALEIQPPPQDTVAFTDVDGDKVVVKLTGPGQMKLTLVNGTAPIESIVLSETSATKSVLGITVKKKEATTSTPAGDGRIALGSITGSSVRVVQARQVNLDGAGINMSGPVASVNLADLKNGADILTTGGNSSQKTRLTLGGVSDGSIIDLDNPVSTMTVKGDFAGDLIVDVAGVLIGNPALKALKVTGSVLGTADIDVNGLISSITAAGFHGTLKAGGVNRFHVKGDLTGDVTFDGAGIVGGKVILNSLNVTGSVLGSDIRVAGNVNRVRAVAFRDSTFFAGYSGGNDGSGDFDSAVTLSSFVITGEDGAFQNSHVIAASFKNVSLRSVDSDNDDDSKFGFVAEVDIGKLTIGKPVTSIYKSGDPPLVIDDFEVRVGTSG